MNGQKPGIRNGKTEKPVAERFNLPGHRFVKLQVATVEKMNCKERLEREEVETGYITISRPK